MAPEARMHDAAYKWLFSRPRMVRDLLDGFVAPGWSDELDFDTLRPLSASYVSQDLEQRHGDLVWRMGFRDRQRCDLVLLLEFQSTVERAMALRMDAYGALLRQRLAAEGELREHGVLPWVLPVVIYNGTRRWTAPLATEDLSATGIEGLAPYESSARYDVLDVGRAAEAGLPAGNLVSALVRLETVREPGDLRASLTVLVGLLQEEADKELRRAFWAWARQRGLAKLLPAGEGDPLEQLQEAATMLEETVRGWTREWFEQGRAKGVEQGIEQGRAKGVEQGLEQGRAEGVAEGVEQGIARERTLLCRQAARKFDGAAGEGLAAALRGVTDPDRLGQVGDWIIECATASDLLGRVRGDGRSGD